MRLKHLVGTAMAALLTLMQLSAHADNAKFPDKTIRLLVPFAPGGSVDSIARPLALSMSTILGQQVIVENRPGASGNLALEDAARSTADGYTLVLGNISTNGINPNLYGDHVKAVSKQLRTVALVASAPSVLAASSKFPADTVAGLVAYVKAHPKTVNHASAGAGSYAMIDMRRLERAANLDMVQVPYKGAGQFVMALVADEVQLAFINASTAIQLVRSGKLKALASTGAKRLPQLPNVPTMAEAGYPTIGTDSWHALFVPAATPQPVVDALNAAVEKTLADPRFREQLRAMTIEPMQASTPAAADQFVQKELVSWAAIVKQFEITVD